MKKKPRNGAVIDDQYEDRKMLGFRLKDVGCSVVSGQEPEELVSPINIEVALIDMVFNGRHLGPAFCEIMRKRHPKCLIIAVSGVDEGEGLFRDAVSMGACCALGKADVTGEKLEEIISIHWCPHHNPIEEQIESGA